MKLFDLDEDDFPSEGIAGTQTHWLVQHPLLQDGKTLISTEYAWSILAFPSPHYFDAECFQLCQSVNSQQYFVFSFSLSLPLCKISPAYYC